MNIKDTFVASLVPIFLGFGFVIAKPAFESFPPVLLMGIRFTFAASLLIWWFPIPKGYLKRIFAASLVANTLQYSITYTGLDLIDASSAVLLVQMEVPFGVIFAYFMLKGLTITCPRAHIAEPKIVRLIPINFPSKLGDPVKI